MIGETLERSRVNSFGPLFFGLSMKRTLLFYLHCKQSQVAINGIYAGKTTLTQEVKLRIICALRFIKDFTEEVALRFNV